MSRGKRWSNKEELVLRENYESLSGKELSNLIGRSLGAIQTKAKIMGLHLSNKEKTNRLRKNGIKNYNNSNLKKWNNRGRKSNYEHKKLQKEKFPERYKAYDLVKYHKSVGNLIQKPCEVCGDQNSQAHHEDYSKPLDVVWLCRKHHRARHCS